MYLFQDYITSQLNASCNKPIAAQQSNHVSKHTNSDADEQVIKHLFYTFLTCLDVNILGILFNFWKRNLSM